VSPEANRTPALRRLGALAVAAALAGCPATESPAPGADAGVSPRADAGPVVRPDAGPVEPPFGVSTKANLRFKRNKRLVADVGRALSLPVEGVCREFGLYDCGTFVHTIALGGVEPYVANLNEPLPETTVTTPIAAERVVLTACAQRVDLDLAGPAAEIFGGLAIGEDGRLADPAGPAPREAIARLYRRAVLREPTAAEVEHLLGLHRDVAADGAPGAARDWAVLACHAVLTSVEALFY
jgi:hypothetical protein